MNSWLSSARVMMLCAFGFLACANAAAAQEGSFLTETPDHSVAIAPSEEPLLREYEDDGSIFTFALENDSFTGSDDGYTNGIRIAWLSAENTVPAWLHKAANWAPFFSRRGHKRYGWALGQSMFAPDDLSQRGLIKDDRPYAGWLYGSVGVMSDTGYRLDNLQLTVGVVGPSAKAAQAQDFVHKYSDSVDPQGWDNQLHDEPGIILTYERKWRGIYELSPFGMGMDVTPHVGASLGNVFTHAAAGATVRLGFDLPADYGPPRIRPSLPGSDFFIPTKAVGGYVFAGVEGRAVAHNIFLDGNVFRSSHSVDKRNFVGSLQAGVAMTFSSVRVAYTHVISTKEFAGQEERDEFGALTMSYRF